MRSRALYGFIFLILASGLLLCPRAARSDEQRKPRGSGRSEGKHTRRPYAFVDYARLKPPRFPLRCAGERKTRKRAQWLVFSSRFCPACRELLSELSAKKQLLDQQGIEVLNVVTDARSCPAARFIGRKMGRFVIARADAHLTATWGVRATPTLFMLHEGRIIAKLLGRAPVSIIFAHYRKRR